jgi:KUP system potassium uptake protein
VVGAALFYGDGIITPAVSVLSAVEGMKDAPGIGHRLAPYVLPISAGILIGLFMVQSRGTAGGQVLRADHRPLVPGPGGLGIYHIHDDLSICGRSCRTTACVFLIDNGFLGFVILGSVFLAVTGAEALYADMGHFGKQPIRAAWLVLVLPALLLNYLGQGALVLSTPGRGPTPSST